MTRTATTTKDNIGQADSAEQASLHHYLTARALATAAAEAERRAAAAFRLEMALAAAR